jgi:hypothetical protein
VWQLRGRTPHMHMHTVTPCIHLREIGPYCPIGLDEGIGRFLWLENQSQLERLEMHFSPSRMPDIPSADDTTVKRGDGSLLEFVTGEQRTDTT